MITLPQTRSSWPRPKAAPYALAAALLLMWVAGAAAQESAIGERQVVCDDKNPCTFDRFVEPHGPCLYIPEENGTPCDDGSFCSGADSCIEGQCTGSGQSPCGSDPGCLYCDEDADACFAVDSDGDGVCDAFDNCGGIFNPDQRNSDCFDTTAGSVGACQDTTALKVEPSGCCDGGDVCDACPATADHELCNPALSGGVTIGPEGGSFSLGDCLHLEIPQGTLTEYVSVSASTLASAASDPELAERPAALERATAYSVYETVLLPRGLPLGGPVHMGVCWSDFDNNGVVDAGVCADGYTPCDSNAGCELSGAAPPCSLSGSTGEAVMVARWDGTTIDSLGGDATYPGNAASCGDIEQQDPGYCAAANTPDTCVDSGTNAGGAVAQCCDTAANYWPLEACSLHDVYLGTLAGSLIPGKGSPLSDCLLEWTVVNPFNDERYDAKGLLSFKQSCVDGDPSCDADAAADGKCTFLVGQCLNVRDGRLFQKSTGKLYCNPRPLASWEIGGPAPLSDDPVQAANAVALRDAIISLDPFAATITGRDEARVEFDPPYDFENACTPTVRFEVPLRGANQDLEGRAKLGVEVTSGPLLVVRDSDKLKLTCLPRP